LKKCRKTIMRWFSYGSGRNLEPWFNPSCRYVCEIWSFLGSEDTSLQVQDGGSKVLRNIGMLPHYYTVSQPKDGGSKVPRNIGMLPHYYTVSKTEDGGSRVPRNIGMLWHHYTVS